MMACLLQADEDNFPPVLLVEDNEANILVMSMFLKELGYRCDVATCGMEALTLFQENVYSLIIMDLNMPQMCGLETTRRIRESEKKRSLSPTPILATTGYATDEDRDMCFSEGMNEYLSKPFRLADLQLKMQELTA